MKALRTSAVAMILAAGSAWAGTGVYHIQQVDPNFDVSAMKGPGVQVHSLPKSTLPPVESRNEAIQKAGLKQETASWDELDKDLLYLRAQHATSTRKLASLYPRLDRAKLAVLMKDVQASK